MVRTGGVGLMDGRWEGNTGLKPDHKRLWDFLKPQTIGDRGP